MMEPLRVRSPSATDIPVAIPGDIALVRQSGLLAWAGAFTVTSDGFEFAIRIVMETEHLWAISEDERDDCSWLEVRYPDGRTCAADLNDMTWTGGNENLLIECMYASADNGTDNSQWWISPLPPAGPVELTIHLSGRNGVTGSGTIDGATLLLAAAAVETCRCRLLCAVGAVLAGQSAAATGQSATRARPAATGSKPWRSTPTSAPRKPNRSVPNSPRPAPRKPYGW